MEGDTHACTELEVLSDERTGGAGLGCHGPEGGSRVGIGRLLLAKHTDGLVLELLRLLRPRYLRLLLALLVGRLWLYALELP